MPSLCDTGRRAQPLFHSVVILKPMDPGRRVIVESQGRMRSWPKVASASIRTSAFAAEKSPDSNVAGGNEQQKSRRNQNLPARGASPLHRRRRQPFNETPLKKRKRCRDRQRSNRRSSHRRPPHRRVLIPHEHNDCEACDAGASTIRKNICGSPAPSIRPSSGNSLGRSAEYCRTMNTANAFIIPGMIRPGCEFSHPDALISMNSVTPGA
jgi:hypothetical protein